MRLITIGRLLLFVCLLASLSVSAASNKDKTKKAKDTKTILVEVTNVKQATIPNEVDALGTLVAMQSVTISSQVDGRVAKIFFKDGQKVAKGMPIIQLDNEQAKADYDSALTALNLSRKKFQRASAVSKLGAISQEDVDTLKAAAEHNKARVKSNLAALNQKEILAPFDGVLGAFTVQVGDYVSSGDALVSLVNISQLKAEYSVPQRFKPELKLDQSVKITSNAYPKKHFLGTVTYISPSVNKATRSIAIQAVVHNDKKLLSPGMFVQVAQTLSENKKALVIPAQALTASIQGYQVYKVVDGKAELTNVGVGVRKDGKAQILKGLSLGDTVVIAGQQKLQDGSPVKIVDDSKGDAN